MALSLQLPLSLSSSSILPFQSSRGRLRGTVQCNIPTKTHNGKLARRSGNYQPPIWSYDYVKSLNSKYAGDVYEKIAVNLKEDAKEMLEQAVGEEEEDSLAGLEMIDDLQRLGVYYHFRDEIGRILERLYEEKSEGLNKEDLHKTALKFRLLRQHGYHVSPEVFTNFMDERGKFKPCLCEDTKGLLSLYEASYLSIQGESILDEARDFTTKILKENLKKGIEKNLAILVGHALEFPLHWRVPRVEARWFIDAYEGRKDMNRKVLELAKLDFNMVQASHLQDLQQMSRWWKGIGCGEKLSFARDRLMENFMWTVGGHYEPQFGYFRRMMTKVNSIITIIDDVYDVYGTLEELELFTNAVERWEISAMEQLPGYMKICFLALFNSTNEMAYDALKEQGWHIIAYLKRVWVDLCKAYLMETKWYYNGYTPTFEEYMNNAWVSISGPVLLTHDYFFTARPITKEALDCLSLDGYPKIIQWSSTILRLVNDLGTSSDELKRGDVPKSIQCYMSKTGASEEEARKHIKQLIAETWKKLNEDGLAGDSFTRTLITSAMNLARMSICMYWNGDGHAGQGPEIRDRIFLLLINPHFTCL